jgi:hypothetical protein
MKINFILCAGVIALALTIQSETQAQAPQLNRFVEGVDAVERLMPADQAVAQLNDPWGALVLRKGVFPNSVDEVLAAINGLSQGGPGLPAQSSFFISESGEIPANASPAPQREFRMVITRAAANDSAMILISAPAGDRSGFIEVMSWDPSKQAFNFYRRPRAPSWDWKGDTNSAFQAGSLGNGCFACHVHGAPIMKELRRPWNNWHSEVASIPPEAIPDKTIATSPLFTQRSGANKLEPVLAGWINKTVNARIAAAAKSGTLSAAPALLRPLFETTTVNLDSSNTQSTSRSSALDLPYSFFLYNDLLSNVLNIDLSPLGVRPTVDRSLYQAALTKFDFHLADGTFSRPGDTFFAFFVPVASFADTQTVGQLIKQNVVTWHFAASVAMVDFPNPVYSPLRSRLLQYVPASAPAGGNDFCQAIADKILAAAATLPADSAERRFADYWNLSDDDLKARIAKDLTDYFAAVRKQLGTPEGVDDYTRLAQSRRDRFAQSALDESELQLLLPKTNIPPADLRMNADGTVTP